MVTGNEIRKKLALSDPNNEFNDARQCHLSLVLERNELTAGVYHLPSKTHFALFEFETRLWEVERVRDINAALDEIEFINFDYKSISLAVGGTPVTLIPNELYEEGHLETYHRSHVPILGTDKLVAHPLKTIPARAIFSAPSIAMEAFKKQFPKLKIMPIQAPFIDYWPRQISAQIGQHIVLRFQSNYMELYAWREHELVLTNTYRVSAPEDCVYFLLFTMEQLHFDANLTEVVLQGGLDESSRTFELIFKYVKLVYWGERPQHEKYSFVFDDLQKPEHFGLFAQPECV